MSLEAKHKMDLDVDWTYEIFKRLNERTDEDIITTTAVIKGTQPMINDQFFWEVEIIYPSNDTDLTVGIGTVDFDLHPLDYQLIAILAKDDETWSILNTVFVPFHLRFNSFCCNKLGELIPDDKNVLKEISLLPGLKTFLENCLDWLLKSRS
ncbi:SPRY domain-containing SOCS box protein 3 [Caerostris darwini]|uniref:SPRY domain-containing SOCS box protein 3 n=1 Tax=Caerostris darwini TaxID=1538125 RepID=A0AAV4PIN3_9ARAC|nr:SPRY domain-containing SOCS box protein 3 [Caerostris darwini]